jgi:hypothetical protein
MSCNGYIVKSTPKGGWKGQQSWWWRHIAKGTEGTEGLSLVPVDLFFLLLLKIEKRQDLPNPLFRGTLPSMAEP